MKKFWKETLHEVIITILTLGINLLMKGKKKHEEMKEDLNESGGQSEES